MHSPRTAVTGRGHRSGTLLTVGRALLVVMGALGLAGALYFSFFASPEEGGVVNAFDWFIAGWKIAVSIGFVVVALAPRMPRRRRVDLAIWLLVADVVFGLVKVFGYRETEAVGFIVVDLALLTLFAVVRRQAPPAESRV